MPVQPVHRAASLSGQLVAAIGEQAQHTGVVIGRDAGEVRARWAATMARPRASIWSVLRSWPVSSSRARAARVAGTSTTISPAAISR